MTWETFWIEWGELSMWRGAGARGEGVADETKRRNDETRGGARKPCEAREPKEPMKMGWEELEKRG